MRSIVNVSLQGMIVSRKDWEEESQEDPAMETGIARTTMYEKDDVSLDLDGEE